MESFYKSKKVLITGHTGFKGSWLTQVLINWGAEVVGVSLPPDTTPNLFSVLGLESKIKNYFADIRKREELEEIFKKERPEIVFHLAAQPIVMVGYDDPVGTIETNVLGTTNLLECIRVIKCVKSAVIITTDKVYENKDWSYGYRENDHLGGYDPYSGSKAAADIVTSSYIQSFFNIKDYGIKHDTLIAIARAGNVIGGGDWAQSRIIPDAIRAYYHDIKKLTIRNPHAVRPWEHVLEPLSGYLLLGKGLYEGVLHCASAWNFGPHNESFVSVKDLLSEIKKHINVEYDIVLDTSRHETSILKLDINKAHTVLGWQPRLRFKENIQMTGEWYVVYYGKSEDVVAFTNKQIKSFFK